MGEIKRGILGGFSGKVGTVVGANWKSISYMRSLAVNVSNPRTAKQRLQRAKFKLCVQFLKPMVDYLNVSYQYLGVNRTPFNAAMADLMGRAVTVSGEQICLDYEKALVASGNLTTPRDPLVEVQGNKLIFSWEDNSGTGNADATDLAMPLVINKETGEVLFLLEAASRTECQAEMELPDSWDNQALAVYLAFRNESATRCSNSQCLLNDAYEGSGGESGGSGSSGGGGDSEVDPDNPLG